jgi:phage/plasmid primase-like uncharacterized protein
MIDINKKLAELGFIPEKAQQKGNVSRCPTVYKTNKRDGWYKILENRVIYGDWALHIEDGYFYTSELKLLTDADKRAWAQNKTKVDTLAREAMKKDAQERKNEIDRYTREVLPKIATAADTHSYLIRKQCDKRWDMSIDLHNNLIIPVYSHAGEVMGYQLIAPEKDIEGKDKKFKTGTSQNGTFYPLRNPGVSIYSAEWLIFVEGVATADSSEKIIEGYTDSKFFIVISTFSAGNMLKVSKHFDKLAPNAEKLVLADNDKAGIEAAIATGYPYVVMSDKAGGDVNDVFCEFGLEESVKIFAKKLNEIKQTGDK